MCSRKETAMAPPTTSAALAARRHSAPVGTLSRNECSSQMATPTTMSANGIKASRSTNEAMAGRAPKRYAKSRMFVRNWMSSHSSAAHNPSQMA
jgi:hypothetical protein